VFVPAPTFRRGTAVVVWAMLRPAANGTAQRALVQWRPRQGAFRTLAVGRTRSADGVMVVSVRPPGTGQIRLTWRDPLGQILASRTVPVRVAAVP